MSEPPAIAIPPPTSGGSGVPGALILAASKAWSQACGLLLLVLSANFLSLDDFGVFALASAMAMVLNQWVGVGSYEYVIREAHHADAPSTAFWLNTGAGIGFAALGCLIAVPAAMVYQAPELAPLLVVLSLLAVPAGWRSVGESVLIGRSRLGAVGAANIIQDAVSFACGAAALFAGWGVWALAAQKIVYFALGPVTTFLAARWLPRLSWRRDHAAGMLRIAGPLTFDRFLVFLLNYGPDLIIGLVLSPAMVGIYRIGARIAVALQSVLIETLRSRAWAQLSAIWSRSRTRVAETAAGILGQSWIVCVPGLVGLAATADLLVGAALGEAWRGSVPVVQLLSLGAIAIVPSIALDPVATCAARVRVLVMLRVVSLALTLPAVLLLAPLGPTAVSIGQFGVNVAGGVAALALLHRLFGVRWDATRVEAMAAAAGCAVMLLAVFGVRELFGAQTGRIALGAELAACAAVGAAAYALTLWAIRRRFAPSLFAPWAG